MTFKEFIKIEEKLGHPNWGGDRRRGVRDMVKLYSPKATQPFTGVHKLDAKHKKSQISIFHK
jgi:hypothetical protein